MMLSALLLLLQSAAAPDALPTLREVQFSECIALALNDPGSAVVQASEWGKKDGGYLAKACHGQALANDFKFAEALPLLRDAAKGAEAAKDKRAARFWAQAGNAAIAASLPDEGLKAVDAALASPTLSAKEQADCQVDRARALVALGREADAAGALAAARQADAQNGMAWLLSATLARRLNKLPDALGYIQTAAALLQHDPAVPLEAGNIAAAAGDDIAARKQWEQVIAVAPKSRQAETAKARLTELGPAPAASAPAASALPATADDQAR